MKAQLEEIYVSSFEGLATMGRIHFQYLFKVDERATIPKFVKMSQFFSSFVNDEDSISLVEEISEDELKQVIHSFLKEKISRPDGWSMEFFLVFYEILGSDLLRVVDEYRVS